jgi:hypothetical protein
MKPAIGRIVKQVLFVTLCTVIGLELAKTPLAQSPRFVKIAKFLGGGVSNGFTPYGKGRG